MIDSRIALGVRPPEFVSPLESAGKALSLRSLVDERELRQLQKQKVLRDFADEETLRQTAIEAGSSPRRLADLLYSRGLPTKALAIEKQLVDTEKSRAATQKDAADTLKTLTTHFRDRLSTVNDDAGLEAYRREVAASPLGADAAARLPARFDAGWRNRELLTASQLLQQNQPKWERVDVGGEVRMIDMNPFTNSTLAGQILTKTPTIGERETARHNRVSEGISGGNLSVARERLAWEQSQPRMRYDPERGVLVDERSGTTRPVTDAAGQPLPQKPTSTQRDELMSVERTKVAAQRLKEMFKPEFVGFKGSMGEFWDQYGSQAIPWAEGNQERIQFRALAADTENQYIKAISGATVPTSEVPRLRRAIPVPSDSPARYKAKLEEMERNLQELPAIIQRSGSFQSRPPGTSPGASGGWSIRRVP